jgi:hypothetical protein
MKPDTQTRSYKTLRNLRLTATWRQTIAANLLRRGRRHFGAGILQ